MAARTKGRVKETRPFSPAAAKSALWRNLKAIALPVALFLVIRTFFVEAYRIPSGSMIPALLVGDWLFVNKLVYGPKVPFTDVHLPGYAEPQRYEVVVFRSPPQIDQPWDPTPTLVKRIVGAPGDTLYMREGVLYLNGIPQPEPAGDALVRGQDTSSELFEWQRSVTARGTRFGPAPDEPTHDNWGPLLIPPGHYFMMGDNRYNSKDSRYWGLVPRGNVRGRPMFVYYSFTRDRGRPLPFITDIRWGRIGHWIR